MLLRPLSYDEGTESPPPELEIDDGTVPWQEVPALLGLSRQMRKIDCDGAEPPSLSRAPPVVVGPCTRPLFSALSTVELLPTPPRNARSLLSAPVRLRSCGATPRVVWRDGTAPAIAVFSSPRAVCASTNPRLNAAFWVSMALSVVWPLVISWLIWTSWSLVVILLSTPSRPTRIRSRSASGLFSVVATPAPRSLSKTLAALRVGSSRLLMN